MRRALILLLALAAVLSSALYVRHRLGHPPALAIPTLAVADLSAHGLRVQYFGTTTLLFRDGDHAVMVDALFTRPGMAQVLFGKVAPDPALVTRRLRQAKVGHADLLLASHSHYDHVLDIGPAAIATGATVVGSPSTRQVAFGAGLPDARIRVVRGGETLAAGPFRVTVFRSLHSRGDRVPGIIEHPVLPPANATAYKEGGTLAFLISDGPTRTLVHASANYLPGMYRGAHADIVFLAIGGLGGQSAQFVADYWREVVEATGARLVIPIHWDDFLRPLDDRPLLPLRRFMDDIPAALARVAPLAARDHVAIRILPVIAPVDIAQAATGPR